MPGCCDCAQHDRGGMRRITGREHSMTLWCARGGVVFSTTTLIDTLVLYFYPQILLNSLNAKVVNSGRLLRKARLVSR